MEQPGKNPNSRLGKAHTVSVPCGLYTVNKMFLVSTKILDAQHKKQMTAWPAYWNWMVWQNRCSFVQHINICPEIVVTVQLPGRRYNTLSPRKIALFYSLQTHNLVCPSSDLSLSTVHKQKMLEVCVMWRIRSPSLDSTVYSFSPKLGCNSHLRTSQQIGRKYPECCILVQFPGHLS